MDAARLVVDGGRKASEVANDVGVTAQSVNAWVKAYMAEKSQPVLNAEALQLKAVMEENRKLKMQVDFLKNDGLLREPIRMRFEFNDDKRCL